MKYIKDLDKQPSWKIPKNKQNQYCTGYIYYADGDLVPIPLLIIEEDHL